MENIEYLKAMCPGCDGRIEFPAQLLGQQADCPHCRKSIVLGAVALPEQKQIATPAFTGWRVWLQEQRKLKTQWLVLTGVLGLWVVLGVSALISQLQERTVPKSVSPVVLSQPVSENSIASEKFSRQPATIDVNGSEIINNRPVNGLNGIWASTLEPMGANLFRDPRTQRVYLYENGLLRDFTTIRVQAEAQAENERMAVELNKTYWDIKKREDMLQAFEQINQRLANPPTINGTATRYGNTVYYYFNSY